VPISKYFCEVFGTGIQITFVLNLQHLQGAIFLQEKRLFLSMGIRKMCKYQT
jgi:hypothetical protein